MPQTCAYCDEKDAFNRFYRNILGERCEFRKCEVCNAQLIAK